MKRIITIIAVAIVTYLILRCSIKLHEYNKIITQLEYYEDYYTKVELVLDECNRVHNIMDTVGEGDIYADYVEARERITIK